MTIKFCNGLFIATFHPLIKSQIFIRFEQHFTKYGYEMTWNKSYYEDVLMSLIKWANKYSILPIGIPISIR